MNEEQINLDQVLNRLERLENTLYRMAKLEQNETKRRIILESLNKK